MSVQMKYVSLFRSETIRTLCYKDSVRLYKCLLVYVPKPQWTERLIEQWPKAFKALDTHTGVCMISDIVPMRTGPTNGAVETLYTPTVRRRLHGCPEAWKSKKNPMPWQTERFRTSSKWPLGFWYWLRFIVWSGFAAALHTLNCGLLWPQIIKEGLRVLEKSQLYAS